MSELITKSNARGLQRHLLSTVSAASLLVVVSAGRANAAQTFLTDSDRPALWVELGGSLEQSGGGQAAWIPQFETVPSDDGFADGSEQPDLQKRQRIQFGVEGRVSFQPSGSDWILSASLRYGRGQRSANFHESVGHAKYSVFGHFLDTKARNVESHAIADFQVGKDVGLGLLGDGGHSTLSAGLRIAQFNSDVRTFATASRSGTAFTQHRYTERAEINRNVSLFGPSLNWSASSPILSGSGLSLDLSANAAVLFGRQKVRGHMSTRYAYYHVTYQHRTDVTYNLSDPNRRNSVVVPNVGGTISVSYHLPAAKLSVGYRADAFFNAVDGGAASRQLYNRGFFGPFATLSIGLGG